MKAKERLLRVRLCCQREITARMSQITEAAPEHQDRYKKGFIDALNFIIDVCDSEVEAENLEIEEEEKSNG